MADFQTVDDNIEYEYCQLCDKTVGGKIHFKIHQTTLHHLKNEEALAAQGLIPNPSPLPEWTDITQYLKYLNIDEPIIGLSVLEQTKDSISDRGNVLLNYKCRLCGVETNLHCTVIHVLGRKHRKWYLDLKRPDMSAGIQTSQNDLQLLKALAAELEELEGWGEPVPLHRTKKAKLKNNKDRSSQPYQVSTERERSHRGEDLFRWSCEMDNTHWRPLSHHDDHLYDEPCRDSKDRQWSKPKDDKYDAPYTGDDGHRRSSEYFRNVHYEDEDTNMGCYLKSGGRSYIGEAYSDVRLDRSFSQIKSSRRNHDFYNDSIDKNRYGEFGSARHTDNRDEVYGSYQRRRPSMDEMEMQDKNVQYSRDERKHYPARERTERRGHRQGHRYIPDEDIPAKKPRTDRFSDDSPLEVDLGYDRSIERMVHNDTVSGKNVNWGVTQFTPKMENVLDVLNNIQIENVQEANFLKERLCTLIKEVQKNKALQTQQRNHVLQSSSSFTDCSSMSRSYMDQINDMLSAARSSSNSGFQQSERYDHDSRWFEGGVGCLQEKQQESVRFKSDIQDLRQFEDNPTSFQRPRGFGDSARDYLRTRQYLEGSDVIKHTQAYVDRDFKYGSMKDPMRVNKGSKNSRHENQMFDLRSPYQTNNKKPFGEFHRDACRTGTADDKRTYQEPWRQCYQHEYSSAGNFSDTFESSSSQAGHSSSLNNLASTLLQLVAHKTN